jgi:putative tryptophan/tyrosine transport system substrate-binding protein
MRGATLARIETTQRAVFVDKILKGANPSELPIEFTSRLEMLVNLRTAKVLGLTVPSSMLARADEVIE